MAITPKELNDIARLSEADALPLYIKFGGNFYSVDGVTSVEGSCGAFLALHSLNIEKEEDDELLQRFKENLKEIFSYLNKENNK